LQLKLTAIIENPTSEPAAFHIQTIPGNFYYVITAESGKLRAPSLALDWQIKRLIAVAARVSYHARRWYVHVASAFPLAHHYREVLARGP